MRRCTDHLFTLDLVYPLGMVTMFINIYIYKDWNASHSQMGANLDYRNMCKSLFVSCPQVRVDGAQEHCEIEEQLLTKSTALFQKSTDLSRGPTPFLDNFSKHHISDQPNQTYFQLQMLFVILAIYPIQDYYIYSYILH